MTHVFISYSKKNRDYAWALRDQLLAEGFNVWIDEVIEPSTNWFDSIVEAIQTCAAFAVIMTPEAKASKWVQREVALAEQLDKPVFPLLRSGDNWPVFVLTQYEPVTGGQLPRPQFYTTLSKHAPRSRKGADVTPAQPDPPQSAAAPVSPSPFTGRGQGGEVHSIDLLPQPFAWITIPTGKLTLISEEGWRDNYVPKGKQGKTFDVLAFDIAKYPTTNAQYAKFVAAGGYSEPKWWTEVGWQTKLQRSWLQPRYWQDAKWNAPEHPIVGVSWYEAVAFCSWLSDLSGEQIMLPTEQQWQRAAQGDINWAYPWAETFDKGRCNMTTRGTTPVRQYEGKGDSPFGVVDMSGNVWEWCLTHYETGSTALAASGFRVLRGGSWEDVSMLNLRADYREWDGPEGRFNYRGFRLARSR